MMLIIIIIIIYAHSCRGVPVSQAPRGAEQHLLVLCEEPLHLARIIQTMIMIMILLILILIMLMMILIIRLLVILMILIISARVAPHATYYGCVSQRWNAKPEGLQHIADCYWGHVRAFLSCLRSWKSQLGFLRHSSFRKATTNVPTAERRTRIYIYIYI